MANLSNSLLTGGSPSAPNVAASNPMGGVRVPSAPTNIGESLNKGLKEVRDKSYGMFKAQQQKTEMKAINASDKIISSAWVAAQKADTDDMLDVYQDHLDKGFAKLAKDTGIEGNSVMLENVRIEFDAKSNRQMDTVIASQMKRTANELVTGYRNSIDEVLLDWENDAITDAERDIRLERTYVQMSEGIGTAFHSEADMLAKLEESRKYALGRMETIIDEKRTLAIAEVDSEAAQIRNDLVNKKISPQEANTALEALGVKTMANPNFRSPDDARAIFLGHGRAIWGMESTLHAAANTETRTGHKNEIEKINLEEKNGTITGEAATIAREAILTKMQGDSAAWPGDNQLMNDYLTWSNPLTLTRDRAAEARRENFATLTQGIRNIESDSSKTIAQKLAELTTLAGQPSSIGAFLSEAELSNHIDEKKHGIIVGSIQSQIANANTARSQHEPDWRKNAEAALTLASKQIDDNKNDLTDREIASLRTMVATRKEELKQTVNAKTLADVDRMATESNAGTVTELTALGVEVSTKLKAEAWDMTASQIHEEQKRVVRTRIEMLFSSLGGKNEDAVNANGLKLYDIYIQNGGTHQGYQNYVDNRINVLRGKGTVALYEAKKDLREDPGLYNAVDDAAILAFVKAKATKLFNDEGHILPQVRHGAGTSQIGDMTTVDDVIDELITDNILYAHDNLHSDKNVELAEILLGVYDRAENKNTIPKINTLRGNVEDARAAVTMAQTQSNFQFGILTSDGDEGLAQLGGRALEKLNTLIENSGDVNLHLKYANNTGVITSGLRSRFNSLMSAEQANYSDAFALLEGLKPFQARQLSGMSQGVFPGANISERLSWMYLNMDDDQKSPFIQSLDQPGHVQAYSEAFADVWIAFNGGKIYTGEQLVDDTQEGDWNAATLALREALSTTGDAFDTNQMLLFLQPAVMRAADDITSGAGIVSTPEQRIARINTLAVHMKGIVDENYVDLVTEDHEDEMFTGNLMPKDTLIEFYGADAKILWEEGGALFTRNAGLGFSFDEETIVHNDLEDIPGQKKSGESGQAKNILAQRTFVLDMPGVGNLLVIPIFENLNTVTPTGFLIYEKDGTQDSGGMRSYNGMENSYFDMDTTVGKDPNDIQNAMAWTMAVKQYDDTYANKNGALEAYTAPPMPGTPISFVQAQGKYRVAVVDTFPTADEVEYAAQILFAARVDGWGIPTSIYPSTWTDSKIKAVHNRYEELLNPGP